MLKRQLQPIISYLIIIILALFITLAGWFWYAQINDLEWGSLVVRDGGEKSLNNYQGEIIKEENGWKKYRNENWGIEFRFKDEGAIL